MDLSTAETRGEDLWKNFGCMYPLICYTLNMPESEEAKTRRRIKDKERQKARRDARSEEEKIIAKEKAKKYVKDHADELKEYHHGYYLAPQANRLRSKRHK